jgi:diketogulonate reductase-like aldo/keto reductase
MPGILYGTAWKKEQTALWVETAIRNGFRGVDTACQPKHYNERGVGEGVQASLRDGLTRGELYLHTSLSGQDPARVPYDAAASLTDQVRQSCAASLQNLQTSYLDCLVLHSPLPTAAQNSEVWRAMESLVDEGRVMRLGMSNCYELETLAALSTSARIKPAVLQNRFYADTGYDRSIRAYCAAHGIVYQSFWTLSANPRVLGHELVVTLARKYRREPAQILFRYLTHTGVVPLTGTRSVQHMREDLAIFEFELTGAERGSLQDLLR